jgi:hypothetical protein
MEFIIVMRQNNLRIFAIAATAWVAGNNDRRTIRAGIISPQKSRSEGRARSNICTSFTILQ